MDFSEDQRRRLALDIHAAIERGDDPISLMGLLGPTTTDWANERRRAVAAEAKLAQIAALCAQVGRWDDLAPDGDSFGFTDDEAEGADRIAYEVLAILGASNNSASE